MLPLPVGKVQTTHPTSVLAFAQRVPYAVRTPSTRLRPQGVLMLPRLLALVPLALLCVVPLQADEKAAPEKPEGFQELFNGRDFTGWRFSGGKEDGATEAPNWKVKDGVIALSGGGSPHLATVDEYGDFDLRLQWRALREKYNSGLYVRSGKKIGANQINLAQGHEGGFIGGKITGAKTVPDLQKPVGEWNSWRVLVKGDKVSFWCNGKLAWEGTGLKPDKGYIGLQAEGAPIEFRNIVIRELKD